ncbi:hypothetical protein T484DRAFT_1890491, partial [Baffinella frigidus]
MVRLGTEVPASARLLPGDRAVAWDDAAVEAVLRGAASRALVLQEKALSQATADTGSRAPPGLRGQWAEDLQTWYQAVRQALARGPGHGWAPAGQALLNVRVLDIGVVALLSVKGLKSGAETLQTLCEGGGGGSGGSGDLRSEGGALPQRGSGDFAAGGFGAAGSGVEMGR